ncbi:hypothetical protein TWF694_009271 [Orbilia ellipsospora]
MENRQQAQVCQICHPQLQPVAEPQPDISEDPDIFHPSKRFRIWLGIGIVIQAFCGLFACLAFFFGPFNGGPYPMRGFAVELVRTLTILYAFIFLHNTTIWFLCVYYNTAIPKNKFFIAVEFLRSVPWLLFVIFSFVVWVISVLATFEYWSRYPPWDLKHEILVWVFWTVIMGTLYCLGVWSLFWMFLRFIKIRKEEIKKFFRLGGETGEDSSVEVDEERGEVEHERRFANERDDLESGEDTPLLVDRSQIV